jgi:hypothetical protein
MDYYFVRRRSLLQLPYKVKLGHESRSLCDTKRFALSYCKEVIVPLAEDQELWPSRAFPCVKTMLETCTRVNARCVCGAIGDLG